MAKVSFKNFVFALKRAGQRRQVNGLLFAIDKKSGDLCGCALGQGLMESGLVDPEEIKTRLLSKGQVRDVEFFDQEGNRECSPALIDTILEGEWMSRIKEMYGTTFASTVYSANDGERASIAKIIDRVYAQFGDQLS